ncbi:MAG: hypothetical protein PHW63_01205 [Alphaproteobacteria bacterium]|nr:hypothetical protein [Alphaproteobacteria bacterium]
MTHALHLIMEIKAAGGRVEIIQPDKLRVFGPADLVKRVRDNKPAVIEALQQLRPVSIDPDTYTFDERAAIIEADGVDRAWAEGFATLCTMPRPSAYSQSRWDQILNDGGLFLDRWKGTVLALGWLPVDVFGVCLDAPVWRLDQMGLVPLLEGRRVIDITADTARIDCGQGVIHTYRRLPRDLRGFCLWELGQKVKQLQKDDGK